MRDLDVKFRTGDITSSVLAWREGMAEWQLIFQISQIKSVLDEGSKEFQNVLQGALGIAESTEPVGVSGVSQRENVEEDLKLERKQSIQEEAEDITQKAALDLIKIGSETKEGQNENQKLDNKDTEKVGEKSLTAE